MTFPDLTKLERLIGKPIADSTDEASLIEACHSLMSKHENLEVDFIMDLVGDSYISGDSERLKQILLNLINNAIEAADQKALAITISTVIIEGDVGCT